jgi:hypothetical protein
MGWTHFKGISVTDDGIGYGDKDSETVLLDSSGKKTTAFGFGVVGCARAKYDFAVDGGGVSTITLATNATLPDNAVIIGGTINSTTACTSGGSATIAFGTSAGSSTTSLLTATAYTSFTLDAKLNSAATFAAPVKLTAAGSVTITIGTAALTAGVIEITLLYFVAAA